VELSIDLIRLPRLRLRLREGRQCWKIEVHVSRADWSVPGGLAAFALR
jgi:hypothetical protein